MSIRFDIPYNFTSEVVAPASNTGGVVVYRASRVYAKNEAFYLVTTADKYFLGFSPDEVVTSTPNTSYISSDASIRDYDDSTYVVTSSLASGSEYTIETLDLGSVKSDLVLLIKHFGGVNSASYVHRIYTSNDGSNYTKVWERGSFNTTYTDLVNISQARYIQLRIYNATGSAYTSTLYTLEVYKYNYNKESHKEN